MRVIKRSGRVEDVKFNKVTNRISKLTNELSESVDVSMVAQQVFSSMYDEIKTHEIDTLSSEVCIGLITKDPDYEILATRIVASNIQKRAANNFHIAMRKLHKAGIITQREPPIAPPIAPSIVPSRPFSGMSNGKSIFPARGAILYLTQMCRTESQKRTCRAPCGFVAVRAAVRAAGQWRLNAPMRHPAGC